MSCNAEQLNQVSYFFLKLLTWIIYAWTAWEGERERERENWWKFYLIGKNIFLLTHKLKEQKFSRSQSVVLSYRVRRKVWSVSSIEYLIFQFSPPTILSLSMFFFCRSLVATYFMRLYFLCIINWNSLLLYLKLWPHMHNYFERQSPLEIYESCGVCVCVCTIKLSFKLRTLS